MVQARDLGKVAANSRTARDGNIGMKRRQEHVSNEVKRGRTIRPDAGLRGTGLRGYQKPAEPHMLSGAPRHAT